MENFLSQSQYSKTSQVPLSCDTIMKRQDKEDIKKEAPKGLAWMRTFYQNWMAGRDFLSGKDVFLFALDWL